MQKLLINASIHNSFSLIFTICIVLFTLWNHVSVVCTCEPFRKQAAGSGTPSRFWSWGARPPSECFLQTSPLQVQSCHPRSPHHAGNFRAWAGGLWGVKVLGVISGPLCWQVHDVWHRHEEVLGGTWARCKGGERPASLHRPGQALPSSTLIREAHIPVPVQREVL